MQLREGAVLIQKLFILSEELLLLLLLLASQLNSLPIVLTGLLMNVFFRFHHYGTEEYLLLSASVYCWIMALIWYAEESDKLHT